MFGRKKLRQENEELRAELAAIKNESDGTVKLTDLEGMREIFGLRPTIAGPVVNSTTAMRCGAVFACIRLIAQAVASLPVVVYRRGETENKPDPKHPLQHVLGLRPNPMLSAMVFWEIVLSHMYLRGNSYCLIGRTRGGDPIDIKPILPDRIFAPEEKNGRLIYPVALDNGSYAVYDQDDVLHIPNIGWDGVKGLSTIQAGAQSVGLSLAAEEQGARFYSNGSMFEFAVKYPKKLSVEAANDMRDYWTRRHAGLTNAHVPPILTEGGDIQQLSLSARDAQLIEARQFQVIDIARFFGVPPHMIGETEKQSSWGSGVEHMSIGFVVYTLRPILKRIEQELEYKLFPSGSHYVKFKHQALMRGDTKTRHESYRVARGSMQEPGYMTVNEIRKLEDLPPIKGGDELMKPATNEPGGDDEKQAEKDFPKRSW